TGLQSHIVTFTYKSIVGMREIYDGAFRRDRVQESVRRLNQRHKDLRRQEHQSRLRADFDAAIAERDALAAEVAEVYPPLVANLAGLMARISATTWSSSASIVRDCRTMPSGSTAPNWWRAVWRASALAGISCRGLRSSCGCRRSSHRDEHCTRGSEHR